MIAIVSQYTAENNETTVVSLFSARPMTQADEADFYITHGFATMDEYYANQYKKSMESQERMNYE